MDVRDLISELVDNDSAHSNVVIETEHDEVHISGVSNLYRNRITISTDERLVTLEHHNQVIDDLREEYEEKLRELQEQLDSLSGRD